MRRAFLAIVLLLASGPGAAPALAAPTARIEVLEQSAESHFPDDLTFHLRVRTDAGTITEATLYLQAGWEEATRLAVPEAFTPAPEVDLTAVWSTSGETVPPFIEITYYWQVTDSSGEVLNTEPVTTEYTDSSLDWQRLEDEHVVVFWHDQPRSFGEELFRAAQESYQHVARITGTTTERAIRIVIYNRQSDFCSFYAPRTCQEWIGGQTFSGITVQWGTNPDWFFYEVVPHELAHVFYGEIFRDTWVPVPTWFNEGIAVYNERTGHDRDLERVRTAAERGELEHLSVMTRGGGVADGDVGLWYAMAYTLVAYITETYSEEGLGELIHTLARNVMFEAALTETTGLDMTQLEIEWRAWLGYPIEAVPTPITLPTMATTPFGLPTAARGEAAPTVTPRPPATSTAEGDETPEQSPSGGPCLGFAGLLLPAGGLVGWRLARRQRHHPPPPATER